MFGPRWKSLPLLLNTLGDFQIRLGAKSPQSGVSNFGSLCAVEYETRIETPTRDGTNVWNDLLAKPRKLKWASPLIGSL